jgi:uncharacterized protein (DUF934 family)
MVQLLENGRPVVDPWTSVADDAPLPEGPVIVSLGRWRGERQGLLGRNTPLGVRLASDQSADALAEDLERLALVALEFPKFRDGRAFTTARALREHQGFRGEIRAVGHVIPDQYLFLVRTGFSTVEVPDGADPERWRQALGEFSVAYQRSQDGAGPLGGLRRRLGPPA